MKKFRSLLGMNANSLPPKSRSNSFSIHHPSIHPPIRSSTININTNTNIHRIRRYNNHSLTNKLYENRKTVLKKLSLNNKSKKDVLKKLETSIFKVENRLKLYIHELVSLQTQQKKYISSAKNELKEWKTTANWDLQSLCNSYYANIQIWINIKLQIASFYCQCFSDKYRCLRKIYQRIKKDMYKYTVDDLILSVEAAMMTAANIRLPLNINRVRNDQKCFASVVNELRIKYDDKKMDVLLPMTTDDRMKHVLTMLVQIINTKNGCTCVKHISDGLPYYHSIDNGFQFSFEQLLFDPHFPQSQIVRDWKSNIMKVRNNFYANPKSKKCKKAYSKILSFSGLSTFAYFLTNSFLESCELTEDKAYYQQLFFDASNLMTCRALFPRVHLFMDDIKVDDEIAVDNDRIYRQRIRWMCCLSQEQMGIENDLQWYSHKERVFAYSEPIFRLHGMTQTYVPQDSIVCVIDSIHDIQKCAMRYFKYNCDGNRVKIITNDCLFPIITYCVVQSGIHCWHQWISMMEKFYTPHILRFGQTGFCFSEICAAVKYIMIQKPSNFGLDDDIDIHNID